MPASLCGLGPCPIDDDAVLRLRAPAVGSPTVGASGRLAALPRWRVTRKGAVGRDRVTVRWAMERKRAARSRRKGRRHDSRATQRRTSAKTPSEMLVGLLTVVLGRKLCRYSWTRWAWAHPHVDKAIAYRSTIPTSFAQKKNNSDKWLTRILNLGHAFRNIYIYIYT